MTTKAGFAALIGKPNAGKSTLLNAILGTKLSIVTRKPQTTRKKVLGIFTEDNHQIVFFDNPGIVEPKYELHKSMMEYIDESLAEADVVLLVIDIRSMKDIGEFFDKNMIERLKNIEKPKIAVLNKIDLLPDIKLLLPIIQKLSDYKLFDEIVPISAKKKAETETIIAMIKKFLPEHEFFYDEDYLSDQNDRFFVSEIIREQIFKYFSEEIPYSCEVQISEYKEREMGKWFISADIIVERSSQKSIIVGAKGEKIKVIGERSREKIENYLEMPVYLKLFVKVKDKWRNDKKTLNSFGY